MGYIMCISHQKCSTTKSWTPRFNNVLSLSPDVFIGSHFFGKFLLLNFQEISYLKQGDFEVEGVAWNP